MGIFTKKTVDEKKEKADALIKAWMNDSSSYIRAEGQRIFEYLNKKKEPVIKPVYLYIDVFEMILSNTINFKPSSYYAYMDIAETIYKQIFLFEEETTDFEYLEKVFIELFDVNGAIAKDIFNIDLFNLFSDKSNFLKWVRVLEKYDNPSNLINFFVYYAATARGYFYDENMFTANLISFTLNIIDAPDTQYVLDCEIKKLEHMAGIYNVDEARIANVEYYCDCADKSLIKAEQLINTSEEKGKAFEDLTNMSYDKIKQLCESEITDINSRISNVNNEINKAIQDYANQQKKVILYQKEEFINSVFADAEAKLNDLKNDSSIVLSTTRAELNKINKSSGDLMSRVNSYFQDDEKIQQVLSNANENQELMSKLDKLMILNDANIEQISKNIEAKYNESFNQAETKTIIAAQKEIYQGSNDSFDDETIAPPNFYFSEDIEFKQRFKMVMERKQELVNQGIYFHEKFDDVLIAVMENANPYLIGPTGCGKTYLVSQLANILDMEFIDIGYINEEYDILGFQTANGGYSKPNFYRCYKYGKIAFCDELDNGNSKATVKLNSFLANTSFTSYSFPNGENVLRHNNFRIIAAGNTAGNGADSNYNTREKIEESVQQRLLPIYVNYDNSVEKKILNDYYDWYEFVVAFRAATDAWAVDNYGEAPGVITTRDVTRIKKYLDNQSFSVSQILDYEFIETKDSTYLAFLNNHMMNNSGSLNNARNLINLFNSKIEAIRNK